MNIDETIDDDLAKTIAIQIYSLGYAVSKIVEDESRMLIEGTGHKAPVGIFSENDVRLFNRRGHRRGGGI